MSEKKFMPSEFTIGQEADWSGAEKINGTHRPLITETPRYTLIGDEEGLMLADHSNGLTYEVTLPDVGADSKYGFIEGLMYMINAAASRTDVADLLMASFDKIAVID